MALLETPKFNPQQYRYFEIDKPCYGGINLNDLEFKQGVNQSPDVLNMMYRNGSFGKRYGQKNVANYTDNVYGFYYYKGNIIVHSGNKIFKRNTTDTQIYSGVPTIAGKFFLFKGILYYLIFGQKYYCYDGTTFKEVEPYIPDVLINRSPNVDAVENVTDTFTGDGTEKEYYLNKLKAEGTDFTSVKVDNVAVTNYTYSSDLNKVTFTTAPANNKAIEIKYSGYKDHSLGDSVDDFNRLGSGFNVTFHGDGTTTTYKLYSGKNNEFLPYDNVNPKVKVITTTGERELVYGTDFTFNNTTGIVTFTTAPSEGTNNVTITAYKTQQEYIDSILKNNIISTYGGTNNSRVFFAGGGDSTYYFSDVYDATYFPESNYAQLGNTEGDISGFGEQYDTLIIFKPKETYAIEYYTYEDSDGFTKGNFTTKLVNSRVGCDCPKSIQLINNLLTWVSTEYGVCTLVSTGIEDERNIRSISYNIEGRNGILYESDLKECVSVDFDSKYFLCMGDKVYMWDYLIAPYWASYLSSQQGQNNQEAKRLAWFVFDNIYATDFLKINNELYYFYGHKINKFCDDFSDFGETIQAHYMTPFLQFGAVDYLKTVKDIYVQCRGDTASVIDMYYYTEESLTPEQEPESIRIGGRIWQHFDWDNFQWLSVNHAKAFRRKCSLKKIEMCAFYFESANEDDKDRDMSISHIGMNYLIVKNVK